LAKGGGTFTFLIIMVLAMVAYSVPFLRNGIGSTADLILSPLFSALGFSWIIIILVLAAITGCYSSLLQKYTIDYDKIQESQKKMKEFQTVFREAQLSGDEKKLKKLTEKRDKMMQDQLAMSQEQFKPMAWIMIVTIPIFLWLLTRIEFMQTLVGTVVTEPVIGTVMTDKAFAIPDIVFPYIGSVGLDQAAFFLPAWILWYMVCSLTLSQVIRKTLNIGGI